jgi:hypothetical protein
MTVKEAYRILGLPPGTDFYDIKKKYRKLMMQVHPDVSDNVKKSVPYYAHDINTAYAVLKEYFYKELPKGTSTSNHRFKQEHQHGIWNAPVNQYAYSDREILQYAEDYDGTIFGNFCVAIGKYLWTTEEDFPLFLLSIYRCSKNMLDEIDSALHRAKPPSNRQQIQAELAYLLAQQFMSATDLLEELAKEESSASDGSRIFYIPSMLEATDGTILLQPGEILYPCRLQQHRLYLKNASGQETGYLSFSDDRFYYIVIPLFEQKAVQIKVQIAEKQSDKKGRPSARYWTLHLWVKFQNQNLSRLPENLNLQIETLLGKYARS